MTEEEAKTKWCPHSGTAMDHPHGGCVGSKCMAWRATEPETERKSIPFGSETRAEDVVAPPGGGWLLRGSTLGERVSDSRNSAIFERIISRTGFCGLAGAPQ